MLWSSELDGRWMGGNSGGGGGSGGAEKDFGGPSHLLPIVCLAF